MKLKQLSLCDVLALVINTECTFSDVMCNSARKDCKMALLQMSSIQEAAEALIVRLLRYCVC